MSWNGMFKKHNSSKKTQVETNVVTQRDINAGGDVVGVSAVPVEPSEMVDRERFERVKAENKRLTEQVQKDCQHEYDRGYEDALKEVIEAIEERDARTGKRQILASMEYMLREYKGKR